jgi:hypothetical protein
MCGQIVNPIWEFLANLGGNGMLSNTCKYDTCLDVIVEKNIFESFVWTLFGQKRHT